MIVLHKEKVIFLKARKVAGTSFEIALSKFADKSSIITPISPADEVIRKRLGFRGPQNYKASFLETAAAGAREVARALLKRERPLKFYNHISAKEARKRLRPSVWETYTKIAIIRNPFDYFVSSYYYSIGQAMSDAPGFEAWVLGHLKYFFWNDRIYKIDDEVVIDRMLRFERLVPEAEELENEHPQLKGLSETLNSIRAKANFRPKSKSLEEIYSEAPKAFLLIRELYAEEIKRFSFDVPKITSPERVRAG